MNESVKWLAECLAEAAEDLEQDIDLDNDEGVPIVAISEDSVLAVDHSVFKKLMSAIGIMKPKSEQVCAAKFNIMYNKYLTFLAGNLLENSRQHIRT